MTKTTSNSPNSATGSSKANQAETPANAPKGAAPTGKPSPSAATGSASAGAQSGTVPASSVKIVPAAEKVPVPNPLPKTWADIKVGSLVIAEEGLEFGWWHAVVIRVDGDILTLKFRDYPKEAAVKRNRKDIALLFRGD